MKFLPLLLIGAAICWIVSEVLELVLGARTTASLLLTAAFHQLIVFGIWGAYLGADRRRGLIALLGSVLVSVGYLVMVYPPLAVVGDPAMTIEAFMDANPGFKAAGLAAVFGTVLFGVSILRTRLDPSWTGLALVIGPLVLAGVMLGDAPATIAIAANLFVAAALLWIGARSLRPSETAR